MEIKKVIIFIILNFLIIFSFCFYISAQENTWQIVPSGRCRDLFESPTSYVFTGHIPSDKRKFLVFNLLWKDQAYGTEYKLNRHRTCSFDIVSPVGQNFAVKTSTYEAYVGDSYAKDPKFKKERRSRKGSMKIKTPIFYEGCPHNVFEIYPLGCLKHSCSQNKLIVLAQIGLSSQRCDV